jgi:hypothetical protein
LSVVEELACVCIHDCHGMLDFILQLCDAACEADHAVLMLLLSHNCRRKAWLA